LQQWTVKRVLDWATLDFSTRGIEPSRLEAELILAHTIKCERIALYTDFDRPLNKGELASFKDNVKRRRQGEPSAYITGSKEFWSLEFEVNAHVLIPRPDTETLVETALSLVYDDAVVLDLCTGSGCIAVALATENKTLQIDASDLSEQACATAIRNIGRHNLNERIAVYNGDLFKPLPTGKRYNMIVSNPPYVIGEEINTLSTEVRNEPRMALDGGGADGLDIILNILKQAKDILSPGGHLLIELDPRQAEEIALSSGPSLFGTRGKIINDLTARPRVVVFEK